MFSFLAPVLSAASTFFGTKAGIAVATAAGSAAVNAVANSAAQKQQNKAAEAAYQRQLAEQQKERDRQAAIDAANKQEQLAIDEKNRATAKADAANKYVDMNAAAQKAGLNPLTVLRATGASGFGAYGGYGSVLQQGVVQPTVQAPILSNQSVAQQIGLGALTGFIDYKANQRMNEHYDRLNELDLEQRKLDIKLSKIQIDEYKKVGSGLGGSNGTGGNNPISSQRTSIEIAGNKTDPADISDAEAVEARYGDIIQEIYGAGVLISDIYKNGMLAISNLTGLKPSANNSERGIAVSNRLTAMKPRVTYNQNGKLVMGPNYRDRFGMGAPYYNY